MKHPKGSFRARKTLQKFGYSVLGHMGALFEPRPPPSDTQRTSDIKSKVQMKRTGPRPPHEYLAEIVKKDHSQ